MFRLWGKIWKNNRMAADTVICDDSPDTRTHKARYEYPGVSKARKSPVLSGQFYRQH